MSEQKTYMKEYYQKNKDKFSIKGKEYYLKNKNKIMERQKEYLKRPKTKELIREYNIKNRGSILKRHKEYNQKPEVKKRNSEYNKIPERIQYLKNYRQKHKEHSKKYQQKPERIQYHKKYYQLPEVKERISKYQQKPEVKEKKNKYMKEYRIKYKEKVIESDRKKRLKNKQQENQRRKELGLPLIGEKEYYNETKLFIYLSSLFRDEEIIRHNRSLLLGGLELDIYIPSLKLAFEYNGKQHYEYTLFFHKTYNDFEIQQLKDNRKQELCEQNGIKLIVFRYDEELSLQLVLQKLKSSDIEFKTQTEIKQYLKL